MRNANRPVQRGFEQLTNGSFAPAHLNVVFLVDSQRAFLRVKNRCQVFVYLPVVRAPRVIGFLALRLNSLECQALEVAVLNVDDVGGAERLGRFFDLLMRVDNYGRASGVLVFNIVEVLT
jgi:hypothetical protein